MNEPAKETVRIDRWLWAARFYKTRSLAKQAIEGGKVYYNGQRVKTSKLVTEGAEIRLRIGWEEKTVVVDGLAERRGNADMAAALYHETETSIQLRKQRGEERKAAHGSLKQPFEGRPTKKQRRDIKRFRQNLE